MYKLSGVILNYLLINANAYKTYKWIQAENLDQMVCILFFLFCLMRVCTSVTLSLESKAIAKSSLCQAHLGIGCYSPRNVFSSRLRHVALITVLADLAKDSTHSKMLKRWTIKCNVGAHSAINPVLHKWNKTTEPIFNYRYWRQINKFSIKYVYRITILKIISKNVI